MVVVLKLEKKNCGGGDCVGCGGCKSYCCDRGVVGSALVVNVVFFVYWSGFRYTN